MLHILRRGHLSVALLAMATAAAKAQFPSAEVSWEGSPVDTTSAKEVFRDPQFSASTVGIVSNTTTPPDQNDSYRSTGQGGFNGLQSYYVFFHWALAGDPNAWVRLSTFNTPQLPNPTLDTRGKVRMRIKNVSEFTQGTVGLCIGVRETGVDTPQLLNGGTSGPIEWVGVSPTINAIVEPATGGDSVANTAAGGDDIQVISVGAAAAPGAVIIEPGPNGVINSTPGGDDLTRYGYHLDAGGNRVPEPAVTIPVGNSWRLVEWNLMTGGVSVDGVPTAGALVAMTGNGTLSDAPNNRGTLEQLAITHVTSDPATFIQLFIDSMQVEATVADTTPAPVIQSPIASGATTVVVNNIIPSATLVTLHVDNGADPDQTIVPANQTATVTFTLPHAAILGNTYTATQTSAFGVSPTSAPVTVTVPPPAAPTLISPIEQGNTTVSVSGVVAGVSQVTIKANGMAIGSVMSPPAGTVAVPVPALTAGPLITATQTGTGGESAPSAVALRVGSGNGPLKVCLGIRETGPAGGTTGAIEWLGASPGAGAPPGGKPLALDNAWQTLTFTPGMDLVRGFTGNGILDGTVGVLEHLAVTVDPAAMGASNGAFTLYVDNVVNVGAGAGGADLVIQNFDAFSAGATERMFRIPNFSGSTSANVVIPPNVSQVSTDFANSAPNSCQLRWFFKDIAATRWLRLTTFNAPAGGNPIIMDLTKPIRLDMLLRPPPPVPPPPTPSLVSPIEQGYTTVTVTGLATNASAVTVLANGSPIATANPMGATMFTLTVPALTAGQSLQARQSASPGGDSLLSEALRVGSGNGPLLVAVGVRETGDTGPIGTMGGTTGAIEWIGATNVGGTPIGKPLAVSNSWQTFTFDPAVDPIANFSGGNGVIDGTGGVFEHLAITVDSAAMGASNGAFVLFIDNVVNVGANAGADVVLQDFELAVVGTEALFQEPGFSGSTSNNIAAPPDESLASAAEHNGAGAQSDRVTWFFKDIGSSRWLRLTTSGTSPIVDLTKPIRMDLLLRPASAFLVNIASANPPAAAQNGGVPYRDVLQNTDTSLNQQGIGLAGTPNEGTVTFAPFQVTFSSTPSPAPTIANIARACTTMFGPNTCPTVSAVTGAGAGPYSITLSGAPPVRECITFTFAGANAGQTLQYQRLPGDMNLNGTTTGQDVLTLVGVINNGTANSNLARYDINRNGTVTGQDVLREVQLINGGSSVSPTTGYNAATVAACP